MQSNVANLQRFYFRSISRSIPGSPPDVRELPAGCVFYDRCTVRKDHRCATERPELREISPGHLVRSFYTTTREAT